MKKVMLGLVMVMMLMSLVGCGETTKKENDKIVENIDGITGEVIYQDSETDGEIQIYALVNKVDEVYTELKATFGAYSFTQSLKNEWFDGLEVQVGDKVLITVNCDSYQDIGWGIKDESLIKSIEKVNE